mgnify:CR=1 FL=1
MNEPCQYHQDVMNKQAEWLATMKTVEERSASSKADIRALFDYLKELTEGQQAIKASQSAGIVVLQEIKHCFDEHLVKYNKFVYDQRIINHEVASFQWFINMVTWIKDKLFWGVALLLVLAVMFMIFATGGLMGKLAAFFGVK